MINLLISGINTILSNLLLHNFIYNYFIAINFFYEAKEGKSKDIALNFFYFLTLNYILNFICFSLGEEYINLEETQYLINILNIILVSLFLGKIRKIKGDRKYYASSIFLINLLNPIEVENILVSSINILMIPLFIYLNLIFVCPLLYKLKLESKKALVSYRVIFIITIALISLTFKAFTGWYQ